MRYLEKDMPNSRCRLDRVEEVERQGSIIKAAHCHLALSRFSSCFLLVKSLVYFQLWGFKQRIVKELRRSHF